MPLKKTTDIIIIIFLILGRCDPEGMLVFIIIIIIISDLSQHMTMLVFILLSLGLRLLDWEP